MHSKNWRLRSCENSSVKLLSNYSLGLLEFVKHKWQISMFVARKHAYIECVICIDFLNMVNISIYITLNKAARLLKQKQIWKNRVITKVRLNKLRNSQTNLRDSAFFNVALFLQHEKKSITVDINHFSRTLWKNIWAVAYGNDCLRSRNSKENSAL